MFSPEVKQGLIGHMPGARDRRRARLDRGRDGQSITTQGHAADRDGASSRSTPTTKVFTDDGREVQPGSGEVGMVANGGHGADRLLQGSRRSRRARSARSAACATSFPGDMATVAADGTLVLFGRGSNCINTGGEKVFPEEVEEALKGHPAVEDALVFGVPDERFGQRVVGVVSLEPGRGDDAPRRSSPTPASASSSYKLPRELLLVERARAPNGKADYRAARAMFD